MARLGPPGMSDIWPLSGATRTFASEIMRGEASWRQRAGGGAKKQERPLRPGAAAPSRIAFRSVCFDGRAGIGRCLWPQKSSRIPMTAPYLILTDAEWERIRLILPVPKRGPRRPHDRAVCAGFLFAKAARVSLESLPIGCYPSADMLRTTLARWRRDGTLDRLMEAGARVTERMRRQYQNHLLELTLNRSGGPVTGQATETMPRWTHIRRRQARASAWRSGIY